MGGLSSGVQWWEQWQLRFLMLGSLFIHFLLYISELVRTKPMLRKSRAVIWMAYVGSDAVAIYALATLFSRHKQQQQPTTTADGRSSVLEVVWAPVLLIHLGGPATISAYSLEDNELWKRHSITLVSQVTLALYVSFKWWSAEERLLPVVVLLFAVGILKFTQKPWALRRASFNIMLASTTAMPSRQKKERSVAHCWTWCTSYLHHTDFSEVENGRRGGGEEQPDLSLEEYVQQAKKFIQDTQQVASDQAAEEDDDNFYYITYTCQMFVDLSAPYSVRLSELRAFVKLGEFYQIRVLEICLGYIFGVLYTKRKTAVSVLGVCLLFLLPLLAIASLVLFTVSHKDGYNDNDVRVTYIMLCGIALEQLLDAFLLLYFPIRYRWLNLLSQCNLMAYCARRRRPTILMKLAAFNCLSEHVNKHWYIGQVSAGFEIMKLVHGHVKDDGWNECIRNAAGYRRFNNLRGQRTLRRHRQLQVLGWSLDVPFDESVLLWHVATDLCFHHRSTSPRGRREPAAQRSREMSNYMIYLLFIRPEMLMTGTRPALFTITCHEIETILKGSKTRLDREEMLAQEIINAMKLLKTPKSSSIVPRACKIADALMELEDEDEMLQVIQGMWLEMLCYSANRCRGYLHAKALGEGGEYLSCVSLFCSFMGMETLADRLQRSESPREEEEKQEKEDASLGASTS